MFGRPIAAGRATLLQQQALAALAALPWSQVSVRLLSPVKGRSDS